MAAEWEKEKAGIMFLKDNVKLMPVLFVGSISSRHVEESDIRSVIMNQSDLCGEGALCHERLLGCPQVPQIVMSGPAGCEK